MTSKKFAIIVMAIGDKYSRQLSYTINGLQRYANKCEADLEICKEIPDPSFHRSILSQKLLLPKKYEQYEWIFFIDLDVLISDNAPSVFNEIGNHFSFSAVIDDRDSTGFKNTVRHVWRQEKILHESHQSYFQSRGFPDNDLLVASINGGAFLCRTSVISPLFENAYWSDLPAASHEEAIMAYIAQTNGLFRPLSKKFNTQFIHEVSARNCNLASYWTNGFYFRILRRMENKLPANVMKYLYPSGYRKFVLDRLNDSYILHFAGGYPFIGIANE